MKVEVGVISRSRRLRLITLTETLIILVITKPEFNNCLIIHWTKENGHDSEWNWKFISKLVKIYKSAAHNSIRNQQTAPFPPSSTFLCFVSPCLQLVFRCLVNEANLDVMFFLLHWRQATQSARTWHDYPEKSCTTVMIARDLECPWHDYCIICSYMASQTLISKNHYTLSANQKREWFQWILIANYWRYFHVCSSALLFNLYLYYVNYRCMYSKSYCKEIKMVKKEKL